MMIIFGPQGQKPKNLLTQIIAVLVWLIVLALAFTFSLFFFAIVIVVGLGYGLYFWWKTRALRAAIREQMQQHASMQQEAPVSENDVESVIIEGEAIRVDDEDDRKTAR